MLFMNVQACNQNFKIWRACANYFDWLVIKMINMPVQLMKHAGFLEVSNNDTVT